MFQNVQHHFLHLLSIDPVIKLSRPVLFKIWITDYLSPPLRKVAYLAKEDLFLKKLENRRKTFYPCFSTDSFPSSKRDPNHLVANNLQQKLQVYVHTRSSHLFASTSAFIFGRRENDTPRLHNQFYALLSDSNPGGDPPCEIIAVLCSWEPPEDRP